MKKILLVCAAGMSTSLLVTKMQKAAQKRNIEVLIEAHAHADVSRYNNEFDACLVGPQIRYAIKDIEKSLPTMGVECIDMLVYGMCDGEKALDQALALCER